mmetsp:Transcript_46917/g.121013  ORF Transcript_46917/g.121013 Transcript_46917/m.121013 type:complete len:176 (+) Transcript_46917:2805-3332(+)
MYQTKASLQVRCLFALFVVGWVGTKVLGLHEYLMFTFFFVSAEDGEKVKVPTIHPRSAVVSSAKALRPLRLPLFLSQLIDLMAENGHHGWCAKMINKGWRHGRFVNKAKNLLPTICPFEKLPDTDKEKLRRPMRGILSQIVRCGYVIEPNPVFEGRSGSSSLLIHAPKKSKPQPE